MIAGEYQPPSVHSLAHGINQALGNVGKTVVYTDPVEARPVDELASSTELVERHPERRSGDAADLRRKSGL